MHKAASFWWKHHIVFREFQLTVGRLLLRRRSRAPRHDCRNGKVRCSSRRRRLCRHHTLVGHCPQQHHKKSNNEEFNHSTAVVHKSRGQHERCKNSTQPRNDYWGPGIARNSVSAHSGGGSSGWKAGTEKGGRACGLPSIRRQRVRWRWRRAMRTGRLMPSAPLTAFHSIQWGRRYVVVILFSFRDEEGSTGRYVWLCSCNYGNGCWLQLLMVFGIGLLMWILRDAYW